MFQQTNIVAFFCWCLAFLHIHVCTFFGGWCMREQVQEQCLGMKVKLWGSCGAWGYGATVAQQPVQNMTKSKRGKWWSLILGKAASYIALWNSSHHMDLHITTCIRPWEGAKPAPWYSVPETCKTQPDRCIFPCTQYVICLHSPPSYHWIPVADLWRPAFMGQHHKVLTVTKGLWPLYSSYPMTPRPSYQYLIYWYSALYILS